MKTDTAINCNLSMNKPIQLTQYLRSNFKLKWQGDHGSSHWARVHCNIKILSKTLDIDKTIGHYFALLHDVARINEGKDIGHGQRAVELLSSYGGHKWLQITDQAYEELCFAITHHSNGLTEGTLTQQACWDADRLDLWRVGIMPDPDRLITEAAKDLHYDRLYEGYYR